MPLFGDVLIGRQEVTDLFKSPLKNFGGLLVSLGKLGRDFIQQISHLYFRERQNPLDDPGSSLWISWTERPQENT